MELLPNDILEYIFVNNFNINNIDKILLVNKNWKNIIDNELFWKKWVQKIGLKKIKKKTWKETLLKNKDDLCHKCGINIAYHLCGECFFSYMNKSDDNDKYISKHFAKEKYSLDENDFRKLSSLIKRYKTCYMFLYHHDEVKEYANNK